MTPFTVRPAMPDDIPGIARVHVESWRTTYKGIMPDEVLANQSVEQREQMWTQTLARIQAEPSLACLLAAEADGQVVGFACGGRERTEHPIYKGELYAIYLLQPYQGQGIGRALVKAVVRHLVESGRTNMIIWVAADNPAVHFYAALGGQPVGSKKETFGEQEIEEIAYGYSDIRPLADQN
jgi:ribosomal protein S18 acetylase RimI-like enzyme